MRKLLVYRNCQNLLDKIIESHIFFCDNRAMEFFPINFYKLSLLKNLNHKIILLRIPKLPSLLKKGLGLGRNLFSREELLCDRLDHFSLTTLKIIKTFS
jgi:hypothetical protein